MKNRNTMDSRKITALGHQLKKDFSRLAQKISLVAETGGRKFKVRVAGGGIGSYRLSLRTSRWLDSLGFDVSYRGRIPGRRGSHVLEVRS